MSGLPEKDTYLHSINAAVWRLYYYTRHVEAYGPVLTGASVTLDDGQVLRARAVIGADGVRSVVGRSLSIPAPNYAGYIAYRCTA